MIYRTWNRMEDGRRQTILRQAAKYHNQIDAL
jgi:hypothetical protein